MRIKDVLKEIFIKIIPIKKNRIVFTSYRGKYCDSPKYICEKIYELNNENELIWLVDKKYEHLIPDYIKVAEYGSLKALYYYASAHILIDNIAGEKSFNLTKNGKLSLLKYKILKFLRTKKNQYLYTTWHGMPGKKIGVDHVGHDKILDAEFPNTTMILGNKHTCNVMKRMTFGKAKIELMGSPRNDILYNKDIKFINNIKKKLNLPIDKKIILFAPTFRTDEDTFESNVGKSGLNQLEEIDFKKLFDVLNEKFGGDWIFICRFHNYVEKMVDWQYLKEQYGEKIINGNLSDDMAEYLLCSDILMSDISSCFFDFFRTKRITFSFFPDIEHYKNEERGLYMPVEDFPFEFSKTFDELIINIKSFDSKKYFNKLEKFIKKYGCLDFPNSSEIIAKYILKEKNLL